jgi:TolB-like protein
MTCDMDSTIQTIAIMEFDNYSTGKYLEELGYITKGLSDFFEADFAQLNNLTVVERDKIDFILKEVMMTQEGLVDQATAVKAGKLLGAQIMVFGSVMQLDHKTKRMMVKAVEVETSKILVTAEESGKDFFEMESELVKELAKKLDMELNDETEKMLDANGTENGEAASLYSRGVYYVDKYEYTEAYEFFKKAYEADNSFTEAKTKMDLYRPLAESS